MIQLNRWLSQIHIGFADTILLNELLNRMDNVGNSKSEGII